MICVMFETNYPTGYSKSLLPVEGKLKGCNLLSLYLMYGDWNFGYRTTQLRISRQLAASARSIHWNGGAGVLALAGGYVAVD